ncbi:DUF805 domain-containing protein [Novosphingobium sp. FSW06-99]|uniref:DUF805 domain-containing protein n=1 Tax=Novosphingobium sp. FSW06-99 TaxID=1739113 RepID=UPI00076BE247|nr:DUF805 domain-containing protein [Novosphingobium sp. FSW06-99]KUR75421.1 hypothetical protein AQZ49_15235 [Novosphingobium sp. FSW06-99]
MIAWMILPYRRYAEFAGRSRRREFWSFWLLNVLVYAVFLALFGQRYGVYRPGIDSVGIRLNGFWGDVYGVVFLASLVPFLAVSARRLHDQDRSGWLLLLVLIPLLGWFALTVLCLLEGTTGPNRYGPDPKHPFDTEAFR